MTVVKKVLHLNNKTLFIIQLLFILFSLFSLTNTDSSANVYVLLFFLGAASLIYNNCTNTHSLPRQKARVYAVASSLFSICVLFANYKYLLLFTGIITLVDTLSKVLIVLVGSFCSSWNTLLLLENIGAQQKQNNSTYICSLKGTILLCFVSISAINIINLFVFEYPGNLTPDSVDQMTQLLSNEYSNHHPFYHTMLVKACVSFGLTLFDEINAAVACYSVFQILFMATCFTSCVATLYQARVPWPWILITICFFTLMPYHIAYSITMWKDIPFGGAVLLLITALFRFFENIGTRQWINWVLLIIGSFGTCLWRSNGWVAFAITSVAFIACFFSCYKKISLTLLIILACTYIMIHPILAHLGVSQPDTIESLSIPAQQIARVSVEEGDISSEELALLDQIIDTDKIPDAYKPYISDPIKNLVRKKGNQDLIKEHKLDYLKLWFSIGLKNPTKYLAAWIDQTKGYWNGGYRYWIWRNSIHENSLGISKMDTISFNKLHGVQRYIFNSFYNEDIFDVFRSIGLCTWTIVCCGFINLANKRNKLAFLVVPPLSIIITLCIATPVYSEFRYAYALFTCAPLIVCATLKKEEDIDG